MGGSLLVDGVGAPGEFWSRHALFEWSEGSSPLENDTHGLPSISHLLRRNAHG